ncbi:hypothetical protein Ddc_15463 [Ditylenchus destructor]|nr:hypothetical protein Ddc_15463 [Ditylenchus destructor]
MGNTAGTQMQQITSSSSSGGSRRNPHFSDYHIQAVSSHHLVLTNGSRQCSRLASLFGCVRDSVGSRLLPPINQPASWPDYVKFTMASLSGSLASSFSADSRISGPCHAQGPAKAGDR